MRKMFKEIDDACERFFGERVIEEGPPKPSEDLVEVVRCRDCKWVEKVEGKYVRYILCGLSHNKAHSNDWFCADGERREE